MADSPMGDDASVTASAMASSGTVLPVNTAVDFEDDSSDEEDEEDAGDLHGLLRDAGVVWRARLHRSLNELSKDPQLQQYYREFYWGFSNFLDSQRIASTGNLLRDPPTPDNIFSSAIASTIKSLPVVGPGFASLTNMVLGKRFPAAYHRAEQSVLAYVMNMYATKEEMWCDVNDIAIAMTYLRRHHFCSENLPRDQAKADVLQLRQHLENNTAPESPFAPGACADGGRLRQVIASAYSGVPGIENVKVPRYCFREVIDLTAPVASLAMGIIQLAWSQTKNIVSILVKIPFAKHVRVHVAATEVRFKCIDNAGRRCIAALPMAHALIEPPANAAGADAAEGEDYPHEITAMDELLRIDCRKAEDAGAPVMWDNLVSKPIEETAAWLQPQSFDDALLDCMELMQALSIKPRSVLGSPLSMISRAPHTPFTIQSGVAGRMLHSAGMFSAEEPRDHAQAMSEGDDAAAASPLSICMRPVPSLPPNLAGVATPYSTANLMFTPASPAASVIDPAAKRRRVSVAPSMGSCMSHGMMTCASDVTPMRVPAEGGDATPAPTAVPAPSVAQTPDSVQWVEALSPPESAAAATPAAADPAPPAPTLSQGSVPQAEDSPLAPETPLASAPAAAPPSGAVPSSVPPATSVPSTTPIAPAGPRVSMSPFYTTATPRMSLPPASAPRGSVSYTGGRPSAARVAGLGAVKSNVPVRRAVPYYSHDAAGIGGMAAGPRMSVGRGRPLARGPYPGTPMTPVTPASVLKKSVTRMSTAPRSVRFSIGGEMARAAHTEALCETPDVSPIQPQELCLSGNTSPPTPAAPVAPVFAQGPPRFSTLAAPQEIDRDEATESRTSTCMSSQELPSQELPSQEEPQQAVPAAAERVPLSQAGVQRVETP